MKKCVKCGAEVEDNTIFCHNCGYRLEEFNNNNVSNNASTKNNKTSGFTIAGFVIGILCTLFALSVITQLSSSIDSLNSLLLDYPTKEGQLGCVIGFIVGYTLFNFVPGIVGTILSGIGMTKKKNALAIIGLILNIISVLVSIFVAVYIFLYV